MLFQPFARGAAFVYSRSFLAKATKMASPQDRTVAGIILAAGKGTRMRSALPKVLHRLAGRPMLAWVCQALREADVERQCLILSEELDGFEAFLESRPELTVTIQKNRLGTGDAVAAAALAF